MTTNALDKRGELTVTIFGKTITLHASFENIALFEQRSGIGIYAFAARMTAMDLRQTDLVYFLWCFNDNRDKDGWTKNDLSMNIMASTSTELLTILESFMNLMFGSLMEGTDEAEPKKTRARRTKS